MSADRLSVAMTAEVRDELAAHLLGHHPEEDLCFALWRPSTGLRRSTALVVEPLLPGPGDRSVHGNASFTMGYALSAVEEARQRDLGVAFLHSHPGGRGWQGMSQPDEVAEARLANLVREVTGLPLVGLTLAGGARSLEIGVERFDDLHPDHETLEAREANTEGVGAFSLADLVRSALRMDPERVIVGEVRGAEGLPENRAQGRVAV